MFMLQQIANILQQASDPLFSLLVARLLQSAVACIVLQSDWSLLLLVNIPSLHCKQSS